MTAVWLGIDPGARHAGIVARQGQTELLGWAVLDRQDFPPAVQVDLDHWVDEIDHAAADIGDHLGVPFGWAIEEFNDPSAAAPLGRIRAQDGIQTARIVECFRRLRPDIVRVPPGGHGKRPLMTYPEHLRTHREWANAIRNNATARPAPQNTNLRHARSAWDIAGAAPAAERVAEAIERSRPRRR